MRKIKSRKALYGYVLPAPVNLSSMLELGKIAEILGRFPDHVLESNVSHGQADYKLYTNDENLANELSSLC